MAREWTSIDVLRLDKFLRLIRRYINASFTYISNQKWDPELLANYVALIGAIPLTTSDRKIPDGLRYHVLDVWVDELDEVDKDRVVPLEEVMKPVSSLKKKGVGKKVRERADETLNDVRLQDWRASESLARVTDKDNHMSQGEAGEEGWGGFEE